MVSSSFICNVMIAEIWSNLTLTTFFTAESVEQIKFEQIIVGLAFCKTTRIVSARHRRNKEGEVSSNLNLSTFVVRGLNLKTVQI